MHQSSTRVTLSALFSDLGFDFVLWILCLQILRRNRLTSYSQADARVEDARVEHDRVVFPGDWRWQGERQKIGLRFLLERFHGSLVELDVVNSEAVREVLECRSLLLDTAWRIWKMFSSDRVGRWAFVCVTNDRPNGKWIRERQRTSVAQEPREHGLGPASERDRRSRWTPSGLCRRSSGWQVCKGFVSIVLVKGSWIKYLKWKRPCSVA